jgi:hypothetical protein
VIYAQQDALPTNVNVGIGTTTPTSRLDVWGSVNIDSALVVKDFVRINKTYEHIKMQASVDENSGYDDAYLVHIRDFILNEVEADIVYLQNKTIGLNHTQIDPDFRYKAWYKAYDKLIIGSEVTPKTDLGPYIIQKSGVIDVSACNEMILKPGFETQLGSDFHAHISCNSCSRPRSAEVGEYFD